MRTGGYRPVRSKHPSLGGDLFSALNRAAQQGKTENLVFNGRYIGR
jgi:hypothetical protein